MAFLIFVFALLPVFNAPNPCAQQPTEQDRLMWVELRGGRPVIISVNPENKPYFTVFLEIGGNPIIKIPEGWRLLHLSNIIFDRQNYLVAQVQRIGGNRVVLRIILPMVLTISPIGDNTYRVLGERKNIAEYIDKGIKQYKEKEEQREKEAIAYERKRGREEAREEELKKQKAKRGKILMLKKRIISEYYFDRLKEDIPCYTTYSVTDANGIVWDIWTCPIEEGSVRFFAKPFTGGRLIIEVRPQIEDGRPNKADLIDQIKKVKEAALL